MSTTRSSFSRLDILWLLGCVLLALVVRLGFQSSYGHRIGIDTRVQADIDTRTFDLWARAIKDGDLLSENSYTPTDHWWTRRIADSDEWARWLPGTKFHQSPLYPYCIALAYWILGDGEAVIPTCQALLSALSVGLLFLLAHRYLGLVGAILAALLLTFCSPSVFYTEFLLRASLLEFVGVLFLLLLDRAMALMRTRDFFGLGLASGLALLAKPVFLVVFPLIVLVLWIQGKGKALIRSLSFVALGAVVVCSPAFVRNALVGAPVFSLTTRGPAAFINGNASASDGTEWFPERTRTELLDGNAKSILGEAGWSTLPVVPVTLGTHEGVGSYIRLLFLKTTAFWNAYEIPNNVDFPVTRVMVPLLRWLPDLRWILALGLMGFVAALFQWKKFSPILLYTILFCGVTVAFFVVGRFRAPVTPVLALLSAHGVLTLVRLIRGVGQEASGRKRNALILSGLTVVFLASLFLVWPRMAEPSLARAKYDLAWRVSEEGRESIRKNEGEKAREMFEKSLLLYNEVLLSPHDPEHPRLKIASHSQTGRIYLETFEDYNNAERIFREVLAMIGDGEAMETLRDKVNTYASLGTLYRVRFERDPTRMGDAARALVEYQRAASFGERAEELGIMNEDIRQPTAWVHCLLAGLELHPNNDWEAAERHYARSLAIKPQYAGALYGLGRIWILQSRDRSLDETREKLENGLLYLEKASRADPPPDSPEVLAGLVALGKSLLAGKSGGDD